MPILKIKTIIKSDIHIVFDLARSIDLHVISTQHTNEKAIAGRTSGLIELGEWVTWRARHFGMYQRLTAKITAFEKPFYFVDEMVEGPFQSFKHEHLFAEENGIITMTDIFNYRSPLGVLGKLADHLFLKKYMTDLLSTRNSVLKDFAESDKWKAVVK